MDLFNNLQVACSKKLFWGCGSTSGYMNGHKLEMWSNRIFSFTFVSKLWHHLFSHTYYRETINLHNTGF